MELVSKVKSTVRDELLKLCGSDPKHAFHKSPPKFCTGCIEKVTNIIEPPEEPPTKKSCHDTVEIDTVYALEVEDDAPQPSSSGLSKESATIYASDASDEEPQPSTSDPNVDKNVYINLDELSPEQRVQLAYDRGKFEHKWCKK